MIILKKNKDVNPPGESPLSATRIVTKRERGATGIPTEYAGVHFRSRLEARYAAFFDRIGWRWEYEPIDLEGYIPDFVLDFARPLLFEVKGDPDRASQIVDAATVAKSGWARDFVVSGPWPRLLGDGHPILGVMGEAIPDGPPGEVHHDIHTARLYACGACEAISVYREDGSWNCRACRATGNGHVLPVSEEAISRAWRDAGNVTQWRGQP